MMASSNSTQRWYLLGLAALTHTLATAIPFSCLPVLFEEISADLGLSLVQIGMVWGMVGLSGVFMALVAGVLGDRFGVKLALGLACILGGLVSASRGLSTNFASLSLTVFAFGLIRAVIPINMHKMVSIWFQGQHLGTANGIVSMGMGVGLMLGPLISATVLSPLLGGWRNVLFLYGAISIVIGILWLLPGVKPQMRSYSTSPPVPAREVIQKLLHIKALWLIGLTLMFRMACITGVMGYLPLYLRQQGWAVANADGVVAGFYAISTLSVIPLSMLSDRIGSRKAILSVALVIALLGLALIPVVDDTGVWILVLAVGIFMDAFMALSLTMAQETRGVAPGYSGTALGLVFTLSNIGAFASPPLGNSLADIDAGMPLLFWASLSLAAIITLIFIRETRQKAGPALPPKS